MQKKYFFIDLEKSISSLEVCWMSEKNMREDMKNLGLTNWHQYNSYDQKCFDNELEADKYLEKFLKAFEDLKKMQNKINKNLPAMSYRRRYLIQTLMGEKLETFRTYEKNWKRGQKFNFHDQTYSITVELKSIRKLGEGNYHYEFENT